jgi:hypothetical protein
MEDDSLMFKIVIHWEFLFKQKRTFSFSLCVHFGLFTYPSQMYQPTQKS